jgi:hypothetical protein
MLQVVRESFRQGGEAAYKAVDDDRLRGATLLGLPAKEWIAADPRFWKPNAIEKSRVARARS